MGAREQQLWQQDSDWDVDVDVDHPHWPFALPAVAPACPRQIPQVISYACQCTQIYTLTTECLQPHADTY